MLRVSDQTPDGAMEPQPESAFPAMLSRWVQEIVLSIPGPARSTLAELIVGAMLAQGGPVTRAVLALTPRLGWQAYHWMLERGRFRLLSLVAALCGIVRRESCRSRCFAIIDDTLAPRCSAKAPGAAVRFDHARKTNRPTFLLCQAFVTLAAVVPCHDRPAARGARRAWPLPRSWPRREDRPGQGLAARGRRPSRPAVPAARRLV